VYLIQFLQEAKKSLSNLVQFAHKVENTTKPAIDQLQTTLVDTSTTLQSVQKQLSTIDDTLNQFKEIAHRVNELEAKLQQKIEKPIMQAAGIFAGVASAIDTFASEFKKK
jgi:ABC-type transporter Mla subunit MlaD